MDIIRVEYEDGTKETCEMNKYGFKIKETDRLGAETKYEYNENGKITKKNRAVMINNIIHIRKQQPDKNNRQRRKKRRVYL